MTAGAVWTADSIIESLFFTGTLDFWPETPMELYLRSVLSLVAAACVYGMYRSARKMRRIIRRERRAVRLSLRARAGSELASRILLFSDEAIMITDAEGTIIEINPAFTRITGYERDEILGNNPRIMKSDRHEADFYEDMWRELTESGQWSGEIWDRRKDGSVFPKWLNINAVYRAGRIVNYLAIFRDLSEIKSNEQKILQLSFHDSVTRLPNRAFLEERVRDRVAASRLSGSKFALLFIDLDRFKYINDTLSHAVGDELLVETARRIRSCLGPDDLVARLGGDEFIVLTADIAHMDEVANLSREILESVRAPAFIRQYELRPGASIGISVFPNDAGDLDALLGHADAAMYRAKEAGGDGYHFYTEALNLKSEHFLFLLSNLPGALARREFHIHYQPQADVRTGRLVGMEALLRWKHPTAGDIAPSEFIPVCEETGLITPLGAHVLEEACRELSSRDFAGAGDLRMSVNVSPRQIQDMQFPARLAAALEQHDLAPARVELEFTESLLVRDEAVARDFLKRLKEIGVRLALDDFGTGYSSLGYLSRFEFDVLKIDRSFTRRIEQSDKSRKLVTGILALAHSLGMEVNVEGVETPGQLDMLRDMGADIYQGYLLSRPMPPSECERFLRSSVSARDFA